MNQPIEINRALRREQLLVARPGPFGETLETFASRAFAVCDHQLAHIYVSDAADIDRTRAVIDALPGVAGTYIGEARAEVGLDHPRSGEIVALSQPSAWFAYPFWLEDGRAPDYARTVDIHRKPGYDPCELFFDPNLRAPKLRAARRLLQKKLGFRTLFDVIPLDPTLVRGSHGLREQDPANRPILIGDGQAPSDELDLTDMRDVLLAALGLPAD